MFEVLQECPTQAALFIGIGWLVGNFLFKTNRIKKAIDIYKECLVLLGNKASEKKTQPVKAVQELLYLQMFCGYVLTNDHSNGIECGRTLLDLLGTSDRKDLVGDVLFHLAKFYEEEYKYGEAKGLLEEALAIQTATGSKKQQVSCCLNLGQVYQSLCKYGKAKDCFEKGCSITREIGDRRGEAVCYGNLANVFMSLGEYPKAKDYFENALALSREFCNIQDEASCYANLANVFKHFGKYHKAIEYSKKAIEMLKNIDDCRKLVAICYGNMGTAFQSLSAYTKAKECHEKALEINNEIGRKDGVAGYYINLGTLVMSMGEFGRAKEYFLEALYITKETANKDGEASCYEHLGSVFKFFCEYAKAREYLEEGLMMRKEMGDRKGEAADYENLAGLLHSLGQYAAARDYHEKAFVIHREIGCKEGESSYYGNLGALFHSLYENGKALEYQEKALGIRKEIGDREGEAVCYGNLGVVFQSLGDYATAKSKQERAIEISQEIGCRTLEAKGYVNLGCVFQFVNDHNKAMEYYEKALLVSKEIGDIQLQASIEGNLGTVYLSIEDHDKAKQCLGTALALSRKAGDTKGELRDNACLASVMLVEGKTDEAKAYLITSIQKCEKIRNFFKDNERFKILHVDQYFHLYQFLSYLFCSTGNHLKGLDIVELGRARTLADLMSAHYSVEPEKVSFNPLSGMGAAGFTAKESRSTCLYISSFKQMLLFWILKEGRLVDFRQIDINVCLENKTPARDLRDVFSDRTYRMFYVVAPELCENRPWFSSNANHPGCISYHPASRLIELDEENQQVRYNPTLSDGYKMIIAPIVDLLDQEAEIIIVPDPVLFKVPFAALQDEGGSYLSETFRIRIVPSLTTLNLIHNSPADYHSQTGALIVGDPGGRWVLYKGCKVYESSLPCAREEARMLGRILGAQTLLGEEATKQAVLHSMHSKSLIHFAAHGNPKTGEIYLARPNFADETPQKEDYLLTMADISKVRLQAKLVVLACCHSADGEIRAEGVVGMARAFLGSGARSVLAARWAIDDKATMRFMFRFYYHLVRGESASESLHKTMKWMRAGRFSFLEWAPFMLIGDNVTFDFHKKRIGSFHVPSEEDDLPENGQFTTRYTPLDL